MHKLIQGFYHQLRSRVIMKQFSQTYMKQIVFLSIIYNIMSELKYSVTFSLNVHGFGQMSKQNIEEPLSWLRTTFGVGLIADITVFYRIVCSFEMKFELVTLVTQLAVPHIPWWCLSNAIFLLRLCTWCRSSRTFTIFDDL